ncbi:MAG: phage tail protein [Proteobacteria bacterium]|nr:phage tail protein [Pseudomonadota bacterium]MBU1419748.1 phage tail protein [Pseudomonadota bacterium]MBU1455896.1 phage tail protein [Pseudomonadota bacterium]
MNLHSLLAAPEGQEEKQNKIQGVVIGVVTNNEDPEGMGRVKVKFPWLSDEDESNWARVASPMAGKERGMYFLPEVDDEVLVAFEHGDMRFPYIIGSLWNGTEPPPASNDDGQNNVRMIKSRSGHVISLTDEDGKEKIEIIDKSEANTIVIDTSKNTITVTADKDIILSAPQGTVTFDGKNIEIKASADIKVEAGGKMDVTAGAAMKIKGATVDIN